MAVYGYARVSTKGQDRYGNSLEAQTIALTSAGAPQENIFKDSFTGTKKSRPQLDKLLPLLQRGDTLIVTKLDRIARSTVHGCELVQELLDRGVTVNVLNMGVIDNSTTGKLIRTIFFAFAEFERDMIVQRTQEGKEIAKHNNPDYKEGRKRKDVSSIEFKNFLEMQKGGLITVDEAIARLGISRSTWYARVREVS